MPLYSATPIPWLRWSVHQAVIGAWEESGGDEGPRADELPDMDAARSEVGELTRASVQNERLNAQILVRRRLLCLLRCPSGYLLFRACS